MGFGVRIGLGKRIGPFRAGVSVSHRGLGYGVGAGPFHLTGGTGRSSRSKSSSSPNTGISGSDIGISDSDYFSTGVGCTGFSPNRVQRNTAPSRPWNAARERESNLLHEASIQYGFFLVLLFGSFPALLTFEVFNYLFFLGGTPFVKSLFLALGAAVVGVLAYGVLMLVAICVARPVEHGDFRSRMGNVNFFVPSDTYRRRGTGELLYRATGTLTLKKFVCWASRPLNFWGVFFFQALPLLPVALAVSRIKAFKKFRADALLVIVGIEAQMEAQFELLESNGFPRAGTEGPRLLNEQEKRLIDNSLKESGTYFCACGYKRAKKLFFVECGVCRFAKNQASRK